jgi:hypothetical protein
MALVEISAVKELLLEAAEALDECAEGFAHPCEVADRLRAAAAALPEGGESDAEAIALVKKYKLQVNPPLYPHGAKSWWVHDNEQHEGRPAPKYGASNESLNRAILECAMKMERDRSEPQKEQQ